MCVYPGTPTGWPTNSTSPGWTSGAVTGSSAGHLVGFVACSKPYLVNVAYPKA